MAASSRPKPRGLYVSRAEFLSVGLLDRCGEFTRARLECGDGKIDLGLLRFRDHQLQAFEVVKRQCPDLVILAAAGIGWWRRSADLRTAA